MKKLLFAAVDMQVGGIETALLTLLNYLVNTNKYNITLVLEEKQGIFLEQLDSRIKIVQYKPSNFNNIIVRKSVNFIKRLNFILKFKNKFDFSASFATYSKMASFVARKASHNSALWGHANYLALYKGDQEKVKDFFDNLHYDEFKHIVFVANEAKETFLKIYPDMKCKTMVCNNLIDYEKIIKLSNEKIEEEKDTYTFVNVGRHEERQKKLTRIIEASKKLKDENIKFKILLIGDGEDTLIYKDKVKELGLQEQIKFLGVKNNPYPYIKMADSVILSSDYEGYPVVFIEALILNKPLITTDVSDAQKDINGKHGIVVKKDTNDIYLAMKKFIENGYTIKEEFSPEKYNLNIINIIEAIINQ